MSEQIHFETPENIEVAYEVSGLGTRFAAWMLDQFLISIVVFVAFFALLLTGAAGESIIEQLDKIIVKRINKICFISFLFDRNPTLYSSNH